MDVWIKFCLWLCCKAFIGTILIKILVSIRNLMIPASVWCGVGEDKAAPKPHQASTTLGRNVIPWTLHYHISYHWHEQ